MLFAALLGAPLVHAQTATNNCGFNAGNQYTVNNACTWQDFNKPGNFSNFVNPNGCDGSNNNDAWGWFTATATTTTITFSPTSSLLRAVLHVFSGDCSNLVQEGCAVSPSNGTNATVTLNTVPGTDYLVRIQRRGNNNAMNGSLCVWSPPPPSNNNPCGFTGLTVPLTCSNTAATNVNATASAIADPPCGDHAGGDVWFRFTAPASGNVNISTSANGLTSSALALYEPSGNCNSTFTLLACADGGGGMASLLHSGLTSGSVYYVRVWGPNGATGTFNICVTRPVNGDLPCLAIPLDGGSACSFTNYSNANTTAAPGIPAPGCAGYVGNDLWFSFVAPPSGHITFRTTAGSQSNWGMAVYGAPGCNGPFTLIECDNLNGPGNMPYLSMTPLDIVPGQTYYLRMWRNGGGTGTFNLCAIVPPPGFDCIYALHMFDSQGDGWGASNVSITLNGGGPQSYTVPTGDRNVAYIGVNAGQTLQLSYNALGSGQNENRYMLQLGVGLLYQDGPPPGTGLRYAHVVDCATPPALISDCVGSMTICSAQNISANPNNTGLSADLNLHNRGCLLNDERQGFWYNFSPSASGTLAFTISPTNQNDDYDFAVWGPLAALACPPMGPPLRCNYSAQTGNTGLSTSASQPSQPAGGSKWSSAMNVVAGEVYLLYVSNWSRSGLSFNLGWQLTNGASLDCLVLPVELLAFDARPSGSDVSITWSTASENGTDHFVVERSTSDSGFTPIAWVPAVGHSLSRSDYRTMDTKPAIGANHYRLRQVDEQGAERISETITVQLRPVQSELHLYPNPATERIHVQFEVRNEEEGRIVVRDAKGRLVLERGHLLSIGPVTLTLNVTHLNVGTYLLQLLNEQGSTLQMGRFVKQ